jgi:hypothetical protein
MKVYIVCNYRQRLIYSKSKFIREAFLDKKKAQERAAHLNSLYLSGGGFSVLTRTVIE